MKNKIPAIIAAVLAIVLLIFSIGFGCASRKQGDSTFEKARSFWQELFERSNDYSYDDSNYEYTPPTAEERDWVKIYSQTYVGFINAVNSSLADIDTIVIYPSDLIYATASEKKEIIKLIEEQLDYSLLDVNLLAVNFEDLYEMKQDGRYIPPYLLVSLGGVNFTENGLSVRGFSLLHPYGSNNSSLCAKWEKNAYGELTLVDCVIEDNYGYSSSYDESIYDYSDYYNESSYDYSEGKNWAEIYSQAYVSFINADKDLLESVKIIFIDTSGANLDYVSDSEKAEIVKSIKSQTGLEVIDVPLEDLYDTTKDKVEMNSCLFVSVSSSIYDGYGISISGYSSKFTETFNVQYFRATWEPDANGNMTFVECVIDKSREEN